jgi:hypothetical protein
MFLLCSQKKFDLQVLVWHGGWVRVAKPRVNINMFPGFLHGTVTM